MSATRIYALALVLLPLTSAVGAAQRPNILLIVADDQSPETLRTYGNRVCQTPHLDRLAEEGLTVDGAYHMGAYVGAVCTPSRHMIMLGRSVWHLPHRPRRNQHGEQQRDLAADIAKFSMPAVFNRAGYDTFRTCKNGNSYQAANELFTVRHDATKRGGTHETGSAWHGDRAVEYLQARHASGDRDPFLMYLGFSHPHDVRNGTPELLKKYGATNAVDPPVTVNDQAPLLQINYLPKHPFHHGHPGLRDEEKVQGVFKSRTEATIRNELGREYACIENIDLQVGRVLDQLERMGALDNTYVIYTADHGIAVGRHGLTGKQNLYEHTWRVPFLVRGPGIQKSSRAMANIYLMDILPTLCDLARVERPETVEGLSFKDVLDGKSDSIRDVLYGVYCGGTKPGIRSVRKGDWKLIKYDVLDGEVRQTQLFNLKDNPHELLSQHHAPDVIALTGNKPDVNQLSLADDPQFAQVRQELERLLLSEQRRLDDPFRFWDQPQD